MANVNPELPVPTNLMMVCHVWDTLLRMDIYGQRSRPKTVPYVVLYPSMINYSLICPIIPSSTQLCKDTSGFAICGTVC
jgi:hypothetical protein